jgi:hypothetical protein
VLVMPAAGNVSRLVSMALLDGPNPKWVRIYNDGGVMIAVDSEHGPTRKLIDACFRGKLKYPDETTRAVSRAMLLTWPGIRATPEARMEALREAIRLRPSGWLYQYYWRAAETLGVDKNEVEKYLLAERTRLEKMDHMVANGAQLLHARQNISVVLYRYYRAMGMRAEATAAQNELKRVARMIDDLRAAWS